MSRPQRRALVVATTAVLMIGVTGCATSLSTLQFQNDNRMKIVAPHQNQKVTAPVTLRWTMKDFTIAKAGAAPANNNTGYFAIFVDRSPVRPGQTLAAVNHRNPTCAHSTLCQTKSYLEGEQVYTTTADQLVLPEVADISGNEQSTQFHTATVVLMDTAGHRIGESAWSIEFKMHASGSDT